MSCEALALTGFWKSVNSANNSKTIMTQGEIAQIGVH